MAKSSSAAWEAVKTLIEESIFNLLNSMTRAEPIEEAYAEFAPEARTKTKDQLHLVAKYAAEYYVAETKAASKVPLERVRQVTRAAIHYALKRLTDESNP
jgi:hypothetical protein